MRSFIILLIFAIISIQALENPIPSMLLQPRDFNPHPYKVEPKRFLIAVSDGEDLGLEQKFYRLAQRFGNTGPIIFPESQEARQQQQQQQEQQRRVVSHIFNQQAIVTPQYQRISLTRKPKKLQRFTTTDELEVPRILAALANHARRVQNNEFQQKSYAPTLQHYNNRIDDDHQHGDHEAESTTIEKKQYNFAYAVKDRQSGDGYSHTQKQENGAVQGSYKVRLPDNRIQITKYIADDNGYRADVTYEDDPQPQEAPVQVQATPQYYSPPQQQQHQQHNNNNKAIRYTVTPTPNREYIHAPTIRKYYPSTTDIPNAYY